MAVHTPGHIVPIHHLHRPIPFTREAMADGAIDAILNMNPMGKDDKFRKFIYSFPRDLPSLLNIFHHFERLRPLADGIGRMASPTEIDIGNPGGPVPLYITMAKNAIQIGCLLVANMIESDGLVYGDPGEDGKDKKEGSFRLNGKSVVGENGS